MLMITGLSFGVCGCLFFALVTEIAALRTHETSWHISALAWVFLSFSMLCLQSIVCLDYGLRPDRKAFIFEEGAGADLCITWKDTVDRTADGCAQLVRRTDGERLVRLIVPRESLAMPERILDMMGIRFSGEFTYRIQDATLWEADRVGISEHSKLVPAEGIPACEVSGACIKPFVDFVFRQLRSS